MTRASEGLRLSAARPALAIADLSAEDILAGMSVETRAAMAASFAADTPKNPPSEEDGEDVTDGGDDEGSETPPKGKDKKEDGGMSGTFATGFAAATERAVAVMSSEHAEGRMAQAVKLLGNAKLSADEITGMLADMPDGSGAAMLDRIKANNPNLGTGGGSEGNDTGQSEASADNHGWGKAHASVAKQMGRKVK